MSEVEIFTPTGVLAGRPRDVPLTNDGPDLAAARRRRGPLVPASTAAAPHRARHQVGPDDILLIVTPAPELTVHMAWYSITLEVGPYRVSGSLADASGLRPGARARAPRRHVRRR